MYLQHLQYVECIFLIILGHLNPSPSQWRSQGVVLGVNPPPIGLKKNVFIV